MSLIFRTVITSVTCLRYNLYGGNKSGRTYSRRYGCYSTSMASPPPMRITQLLILSLHMSWSSDVDITDNFVTVHRKDFFLVQKKIIIACSVYIRVYIHFFVQFIHWVKLQYGVPYRVSRLRSTSGCAMLGICGEQHLNCSIFSLPIQNLYLILIVYALQTKLLLKRL